MILDTSLNPRAFLSNETQNQFPEVTFRHNHNATDREPTEHRPPPNWRTNIRMDEKLIICRKYYLAGFFVLPLFWLVNFIWYYKDAYQTEPFDEQPEFKRYVVRSGIGFIFWTVLITIWVLYFQTQRHNSSFDFITFNFPTGSA